MQDINERNIISVISRDKDKDKDKDNKTSVNKQQIPRYPGNKCKRTTFEGLDFSGGAKAGEGGKYC